MATKRGSEWAARTLGHTEVSQKQAEEALDYLEESLRETLQAATAFVRLVRRTDPHLAGECETCLVRHLHSFLEDEDQNGSIPSLRRALADWSGGDDEDDADQ